MSTDETYRGVVHGSTIELHHSPGVPDGVEVEVVIKRRKLTDEQRKQQLNSLFGSCREDADDLDEFLRWNGQQRKLNRTDQSP